MMIRSEQQTILDRVDTVAAQIAADRTGLMARSDFPANLWQVLGDSGLLGLTLPVDMGGLGGNYATLAAAARRLSEKGGVLGVTVSWLCHVMNARLHLDRKGTAAQRERWLPRLAKGDSTICIAISEPGVGAHPKHLTTAARRDGDDYVIDGRKTYLTNGPLADLFIVLAITGEADGLKTFSAILVPRDTPGLTQTPGVEVDFLHPSPHCGIELNTCRVPVENILGTPDGGLAEISLPMRAIEDALATSSLAGAMNAQLRHLAGALPAVPDKDALADLGQLLGKADALAAMAAALADDLDGDDRAPERLNAASAGFRGFLRSLQDELDAFVGALGVVLSPDARNLRRDLMKSLSIAGAVHRIQAAKRASVYLQEGKPE